MKKLLHLLLLILCTEAFAHPVIYKDGVALSSMNMADFSNNYIMYSFSQKSALGIEHWRFSQGDKNNELGLIKLNHLLWRKNEENSQANVYLHSGLGFEDQEFDQKKSRGAYLVGVEGDWENRDYYTSLKHLRFNDLSLTQGRVGFSPQRADFEKLQTWFMVQAMVIDEIQETVMLTPMVRFFYQNVLWEMGSSTRGDWMLNLMVHY
jgi:hypothetical protein